MVYSDDLLDMISEDADLAFRAGPQSSERYSSTPASSFGRNIRPFKSIQSLVKAHHGS